MEAHSERNGPASKQTVLRRDVGVQPKQVRRVVHAIHLAQSVVVLAERRTHFFWPIVRVVILLSVSGNGFRFVHLVHRYRLGRAKLRIRSPPLRPLSPPPDPTVTNCSPFTI